MILKKDSFAIIKINWESKDRNIAEACDELNIGLDSAVFFDDNPAERELIKSMLPQVTVADFPDKEEDLPDVMAEIYHEYFEKAHVTKEDLEKTRQYAQNAERRELLKSTGSFEEYLKSLEMVMKRENPAAHVERFLQLVNKTNQFNLTTGRYTLDELTEIINNPDKRVFLYSVADRFGDNGIVAALIADVSGETACIEEFVMSCRVMGRHIEHAIITDVENQLGCDGVKILRGIYIPTSKNGPVAGLYDELGYTLSAEEADGRAEYEVEIQIAKRVKRVYYVDII
jgi:FkbH-like protein